LVAIVLHLSDIHIKTENDPVLKRAPEIARAMYRSLPEASTVLVAVSGDIAYSGTADQYESAFRFLSALKTEIQNEKAVPVYFIPCPGNHDCDFSKDDSTRKLVLSGIQSNGTDSIDHSVVSTCVKVQEAYFQFEEKLTAEIPNKAGDELWKSYDFCIEGKDLTFDALNVAWASQLQEQQGTLSFPYEKYSSKLKSISDIRIAVLHQPFNWFGQATYRPFRQFLRELSNIVMTGHEHVGVFGENHDSSSGSSAYVEGWVLQGERDLSDSSFGLIELDLESQTYRATKFQWESDLYAPSEEASWQDYRSLPTKQKNPLAISSKFLRLLRDPGGNFHSALGDEVSLEDIYVYPDLQSQDEEGGNELISTSVLRDRSWLKEGVLLVGEERVGASSLLYRLFDIHHDAGLVPLYVRGTDLKASGERELETVIKHAVQEQYGPDSLVRYEQLPRESKLLLLDDFDDSPLKASSHRSKVIDFLAKRFGQSVITVGELFSLSDLFSTPDVDCFKDYKRYKVLPFGFSRRADLIRKWFQLTARDGSMSEVDFQAKCHSSERLFDTVMVRNIIPSLPLYLLTLLQGVDSGVGGSFQESALGKYYGFLFDDSLRNAGIQPQKWEPITEYCSHLAWYFHGSGSKVLELTRLKAFSTQFEVEQHAVNFDSRLSELVAARILVEDGNCYRFRYHYIYYYLKGRYLSTRLDDLEVQAYVKRCCTHLYARENANTLLFLAHHAYTDKFFLSCIVGALNQPFAGGPESRFDGQDTTKVAELVREAPKLVYSGETPEQHRDRINKQRDNGEQTDGLTDKEEDGDELSLPAQIASTAKTVEILGQVLKNQYSVIPRAQRVDMLKQLIRGPLRGIHAVFDAFLRDKEIVIAELEDILEKKAKISDPERRSAMSRRILANLLQGVAFGFVHRTAASISSRELADDIHTATKSIGTPAARLVELAVALDSPDPLPREKLKKLNADVKTDIVGGSLVQFIALQRLYMFKMSHDDKQWLASQEILDLKNMGAVSYRGKHTRRLKGN